MADTVGSKSAVKEALNAVSWVHQLAGYHPLSEPVFLHIVLEGLQRKLAKPKVRKEPITTDMIQVLVESLCPNPSLADVRLVAACLPAFAAFLQYDKLSKLHCCDITFKAQSICQST